MKKLLFLFVFLIPACAMQYQQPGPSIQAPVLTDEGFISADGSDHGLTIWAPPVVDPFAILVGVHGFNDYRMAFDLPGQYLSENGVLVLAFDQRGFGEDEKAGYWAKKEALKGDLLAFLSLVRMKYPGLPVFVMGASMGGAVALYALAGDEAAADGLILIAPAVWGWRPVNIVYRPALWFAAHIMPGKKFTGRGLHLQASDNIDALIALSEDPLIIKKTRLDAIYGLSRVMKSAMKSAPGITIPTYLLYGENDEIVPAKNTRHLWDRLPEGLKTRKVFEGGYHLLLRDCGAGPAWQDILVFLAHHSGLQMKTGEPPENLCKTNKDGE